MARVTKENNGRAARRRLARRIAVAVGLTVALLTIVTLLRSSSSGAGDRSDAASGTTRGARSRNEFGGDAGHNRAYHRHHRPGEQQRRGRVSGSTRVAATEQDVADILAAKLSLTEIRIDSEELMEQLEDPDADDDEAVDSVVYGGVYGTFCRVAWHLHKQDPSSYPMFRDVVAASTDCQGDDQITADVREMARKAREHDAAEGTNVLELTAAVFHESRCGSTLVANLLASVHPDRHRVYSESSPPITVLKGVCGEDYSQCSANVVAAVLRDVVYLMSRSDDPAEQRVFFKVQSAGSRNVDAFSTAFPETPWLFVYREPVQVMMSHLKQGYRHANCLQHHKSPPGSVHRVLTDHGVEDVHDVVPEDYCAAHLASITETIVKNLDENAIPVNYQDLPDRLYHDIFPSLGLTVDAAALKRMQRTAAVYSKGRGKKQGQEFESDNEQKEAAASAAVRHAAEKFLQPSYEELEQIASDMKEGSVREEQR